MLSFCTDYYQIIFYHSIASLTFYSNMSDNFGINFVNGALQAVTNPQAIEYASLFAGFTLLISPAALFQSPIFSVLVGMVGAYTVKFFATGFYNLLPDNFKPIFVIGLCGSGLLRIYASLFRRKKPTREIIPNPSSGLSTLNGPPPRYQK